MLEALRQKLWMLAHRRSKDRFDLVRLQNLDGRHNRHHASGRPCILIVRDFRWGEHYNDHFLDWLRETHPDLNRHIVLGRLPGFDVSVKDVALLVPWLQDPLRELWPAKFSQASRLERRVRQAGARVVNPVASLSVSRKSVALPLLGQQGVRTAKVVSLDVAQPGHVLESLSFPFFIRDDLVHGCPTQIVHSESDLEQVDWSRWSHPIAVEFIDTRSEDGFFRKFRYCMFGTQGHNRHLIISSDWYVHAKQRGAAKTQYQEESEFCLSQENPHHETFDKLRRRLNLDFVAFDYGFDVEGRLVIWEPNPFPILYNGQSGYPSSPEFVTPVYEKLLRFLVRRAHLEVKFGSSTI